VRWWRSASTMRHDDKSVAVWASNRYALGAAGSEVELLSGANPHTDNDNC
jgi:hypothetical protein